MQKFLLENPAKTIWRKLLNIGIGFILMLVWCALMKIFLEYIEYPFMAVTAKFTFFASCIIAPIWEELYFFCDIRPSARNGPF
jgi:hypothetical protein